MKRAALVVVLAFGLVVAGLAAWGIDGPGPTPSDTAPTPVDPVGTERVRDATPRRRITTHSDRGGRVVDAEGHPVADIDVVAYRNAQAWGRVASVRTDAEGRFALAPLRGFDAIAIRPGIACSEFKPIDEMTARLVLTLGEGATATGRVQSADGAPAAGVPVSIELEATVGGVAWPTRSAADGSYRVAGIPAGWWVHPCIPYRDRYGPADAGSEPHVSGTAHQALESGRAALAGPAGSKIVRTLTAREFPRSRVTFRLAFPDGATVPDRIIVETWDGDRRRESVREERVDPHAPRFHHDVDVGRSVTVGVRAGRYGGASVPVHAHDESPQECTIELRNSARVVARVVDAEGRHHVAPGITAHVGVAIGNAHTTTASAPTTAESDGHIDLTLQLPVPAVLDDPDVSVTIVLEGPGVFRASIRGDSPNLRLTGPELATRLRSGDDPVILDVPLLPPREITVQALDRDGEPVPGVRLTTRPRGTFWPAELETDASGRATFAILAEPDATYAWNLAMIRAASPWAGSFDFPDIGERYRRGGDVRFRVLPLNEFVVTVVDDAGAPLPDAELWIGRRRFAANESGVAVVHALPGSRIYVARHGYRQSDTRLAAAQREITLVARRMRSVVLHLEHADATWVGHARCRITMDAGIEGQKPEQWATPDVALGPGISPTALVTLPMTPGRVAVETTDLNWRGTADVTADATDVRVRLERARRVPVRVRFVDAAGRAVSSRTVTLRLPGAPAALDGEFVTDPNGEVRVELPEGDHGAAQWAFTDGPRGRVRLRAPAADAVRVIVETGE